LKPQQTIENQAEIRGRGLFTGDDVIVRFRPAPTDSGVTFVRTEGPATSRIKAHVSNVTKRSRRTALKNGTLAVETVEHCLAALYGLGIDNIEVEVNGGELPGGDGSSLLFVDALKSAGVLEQDAPRRPLRITETIRVADGEAELIAVPTDADALDILYDLNYGENSAIPRQFLAIRLTDVAFCNDIAPARTFLLEEEARQFRAAGLGAHLTYADVVVIGPHGVIDNELRFPDECVRHKILDLIGDIYLAGRPLYGKVIATRSGHALNHELVRRLIESVDRRDRNDKLAKKVAIDAAGLHRILPHRFPFLLIDRVVEMQGDRRAIGIKNVSINEPFFQGHFPAQPIMPGVLVIEAMAQLAGILLSQKLEHAGKIAVLLSMDHVKFRRQVVPGDRLVLEVETLRVKARTGHVRATASVDEALVAQAEIKFMLVDAEPAS